VECIGLTPVAAQKVKSPLIAECRAHLECASVKHVAFGEEVVLFGRIVAASVDRGAMEAQVAYAYLRLFAFLEDGSYGVIERSERVSGKVL
jgi:flavin reductase (DIM6/NTAB) family NADH-FMN oxidoreductase RutF